ncbi:MAG: ABC transporter substrate-binding protein [Proteobacteria bacterium]|nr:ABC transporter substrate-binding protein [Pseudomonadota bacterium]
MKKLVATLMVAAVCLCFCAGVAQAKEAAAPVKIGCLFDLQGPAGHIGIASKLVAEMLAERLNKAGGIGGRPIQLVMGDTESNPGKAVIEAKRLVENEQVDAIIGPTRTDSGMAIINYIEKMGIPTVGCIGGTPVVVPVRKWMFKSPQKSVTAVERICQYLQKKAIKKIAVITATDKFGQEGEEALKALSGKYGITIVAQEKFEVSDVDMTVQLTKIKTNDPQAVICWTIGPPGSLVAKNVKQLGFTIPLIQCHGLPDPKYLELAGDAAEGNIMPSTKLMVAGQLPDSDPQKKLLLEYTDLYENVGKIGKITTHGGYAWDALMLVAGAMKKAGTDKAKVRDAIESTKGYVGVSGIYNMTPEDHCGLGVDSMVMITVKNGKFTLLE